MSNRIIQFRAWDSWNNAMHYPADEKFVLQFGGKIGHFNGKTYDTVDWILEQLTDEVDRNKKPIYEGDICKIHYFHLPAEAHVIGVVEWIDNAFSIRGVKNLKGEQLTSLYSLRFRSGGNFGDYPAVEVLGNIHQNPELLTKT